MCTRSVCTWRRLLALAAVVLAAGGATRATAQGEPPPPPAETSAPPPAETRAAAPPTATASCADCHEAVVKAFTANPHARGQGTRACESCHAGAAAHAQTGDPSQVRSFRRLAAEPASAACLECHRRDRAQTFWKGSPHEAHELGCTSCHAVHPNRRKLLVREDQNATCFTCHAEVRADVLKRSAHPLRNVATSSMAGSMECSSCHNPHGAQSRSLIDARSVNDKCYQCHAEMRAPVLWEHSPVKEDCLNCHRPHGSSNERLLVNRVPRLCQECHMQGRHQSGTLASNSVFAINRSCLNCHPQVHGSNNPSGTVLQR